MQVKERAATFQALRAESARHAIQLDLALRAWERHDLVEAERVLDEVSPAFQQSWEQRHLRDLCRNVRRLSAHAGPHVLGIKGNSNAAVAAVSSDGLLVAFAGLHSSFKARASASNPTNVNPAPGTNPSEIRVYELATGREKLTLRTSMRFISSLAFSPDGRHIILGDGGVFQLDSKPGEQGLVEVFDVSQRASGCGPCVARAGMSWTRFTAWPSVRTACSSSREPGMDTAKRVRDATTGRETLSLQGPVGKILRLTFSPDGRWIATVHEQGGVWLWDGATGEQKRLLMQMPDPIPIPWSLILAFSPDGRRIALTKFGQPVQVYDVATGQRQVTFSVHQAQGLAFSPDGERIAVADGGETVPIFDAATGRKTQTLTGHKKPVCGVAFSADGKRLASGDWDGTVKVWDLTTRRAEHSSREGAAGWVTALAFSPDGRRLAFCEHLHRPVHVWNLDTGKVDKFEGTLNNQGLSGFAFSPDGKRFTAGGPLITPPVRHEGITEWDAATGKIQGTLQVPNDALALVYLAAGPRLAARSADGSVYVQDAANGKRSFNLSASKLIGPIGSVAFNPDSKQLRPGTGTGRSRFGARLRAGKCSLSRDPWVRSLGNRSPLTGFG